MLATGHASGNNAIMNTKEENGLQFFTTILAYSLPLLQFFFGQLTGDIQKLFLFKTYFVVVSVFTAIASYVMIIVLRSTPWFELAPFQYKKKKDIRAWQTYTNSSVYTTDEIKKYEAKHTPPSLLKVIKPDNVTAKVFLPLLVLSFIVFMALGLRYGNTEGFVVNNALDVTKVLVQSVAYASFLVFAVLSFAHQYIRDSGRRKWQQQKSSKFEKAIQLARQRDAFKELKKISLISQKDVDLGNPNSIIAFLAKVDDKYCAVITDNEVDTIILVKEFDNPIDAENYVWGTAPVAEETAHV